MSSLPVRRVKTAAPVPAAAVSALSVVIPAQDVVVPAPAHTLNGFRAWALSDAFPDRGRVSFLDTEIFVDMSPEEMQTHSKVKLEVCRVLANFNRRRKLGELYPDGVLLTNGHAGLSTESDASLVTYESIETGRVRLIPREGAEGQYIELEGTPDWVMEVVSNSSVRKDTERLRELYYRAGVPEYWLIDARGAEIEFEILLRGESEYVCQPGRSGWQTSPLFQRRFRLVREAGRLGLWEYTLQTKPLR